ncbi:Cytochrome c oxidase subunit 3 (mitochondrion) [Cafeteria roenbergensis]|uniref:Cytochrome c oxidase subunit 3 n=1 Tax=Cafeteria roenbergensis TaxID=33653 RepID=A0A5A8C069_CAFRO|nr:Cytochrome c oxidase subunit 3 [Cafeteria roenbergensis]KAA0145465.1 Cytochrome c oxidase subunit 3 [Cafeteria roenbergensis]KAA0145500.1 Cytochrome c oxidase subunit 3 [Cafeteria roenbergensis]KAA0158018.1 Cytochrome c oxidase subunit 3 [Cafeteria roenbergensis]|eukprot:KAA0145429.1 Cytochrome c oxidase subunit 3 (mitochondrion) [Cafeteria roenbergensis]
MMRLVQTQKHPFHVVDSSPWPLFTALSVFLTFSGLTLYMHFYSKGGFILALGLFFVVICASFWWRDVVREATFEGQHTSFVRNGLKMGMVLFIISEAMLFFAFFWGFFHASLNPVPEIGCVWPPKGIEALNPFHVPFLNTLVLVHSGAMVTWAHYSVLAGNRRDAISALIFTILLAVFFTFLQAYEYVNAPFGLSDNVYGSVFFMTTGLHGFHVIIGTLFLAVCLIRLITHHLTKKIHVGFEAAIWYWHFVDVVWIFVFIFIYWWAFPVEV